MRLLLEAGAQPNGSHALAHALDYERPEHVGCCSTPGRRRTAATWCMRCAGAGTPRRSSCSSTKGADLDALGGEWSTPEAQYRTAWQNAFIRNRADLLPLLRTGPRSATRRWRRSLVASGLRCPTSSTRISRRCWPRRRCTGTWTSSWSCSASTASCTTAAGRRARCCTWRPGSGTLALVERLLELGADPQAAAQRHRHPARLGATTAATATTSASLALLADAD